jgi:UDP-glucose 4-epimerase
MTRHLILGGCGFIGRHVALALQQRGDDVVIADIAPPSPEMAARLQVEYRAVDPAAPDWTAIVAGCDVVHHYAWTTVPSSANADPLGDLDANLRTTVRLLMALDASPGKRLIFASSGGTVYGRLRQIPVVEDHPFSPITAYGVSKASAELYLNYFHAMGRVDCRIARISNPFGAGQNPQRQQGAVSTFVFKALAGEPISLWGDGSVVRDYIHVADLCAGLLALTDAEFAQGNAAPTFNIGSGEGVSLNAILETLRTHLQLNPRVEYQGARAFDIPVSVLDTSRARDILGWTPRLSFAEGCARMVSDLRQPHDLFSTLLD